MAGGYSAEAAPSHDAARLAVSQRAAAEARLGTAFARFEPVAASQQVVAGMNYRVKVRVPRLPRGTFSDTSLLPLSSSARARQVRVGAGDADFVHLAIFEPLPHTQQPPEVLQPARRTHSHQSRIADALRLPRRQQLVSVCGGMTRDAPLQD